MPIPPPVMIRPRNIAPVRWPGLAVALLACAAGAGVVSKATAQTAQLIAGAFPAAGLVQAPDGSIYGTTYAGGGSKQCGTPQSGMSGCGTVFRIDPSGTASSIYSFSGKGALAHPGAVGVDTDGNLYGATEANTGNGGIAFSLTPAGTLTKIGTLKAEAPEWAGLLAVNGRLYAPDQEGQSIFSFGPQAKLKYIKTLAKLGNNEIETGLTLGSDGALYGAGGLCLFRVTLAGKARNLYCGSENYDPGTFSNSLALGADQNLYGMTQAGGANDGGVYFKVDAGGNFTKLADLLSTWSAAANGLTLGNDGNFYSNLEMGGEYDEAGLLVVATTAGDVNELFEFGEQVGTYPTEYYPTGLGPIGNLLKAHDGTLWGVTSAGGILGQIGPNTYVNSGYGTVFQFRPSTGQLTTIVDFSGQ